MRLVTENDTGQPLRAEAGPAEQGEGSEEGQSRSSSTGRPFTERLFGGFGRGVSSMIAGRETPPPMPEEVQQQHTDRQKLLLANVERMGEMRVSDAMVPRADIVGIEISASYDEVVTAFRNVGHSRLPVYNDTLDDAEGFIHVKDVFMRTGQGTAPPMPETFNVREFMRRLLTVPPSMRCGILLQKMQADRVHMALVIDEYGGVDGLVTIEDLLELIVGEIEDEHDATVEAFWKKQGDGVYQVDARAWLDEFQAETGVLLLEPGKNDDVDTLGGLVFMICNRIPARGEVIRHEDGHEFEILDADPRRIKRMRVSLVLPENAGTAGDASLQAAQ